jgi:hypothetical protein
MTRACHRNRYDQPLRLDRGEGRGEVSNRWGCGAPQPLNPVQRSRCGRKDGRRSNAAPPGRGCPQITLIILRTPVNLHDLRNLRTFCFLPLRLERGEGRGEVSIRSGLVGSGRNEPSDPNLTPPVRSGRPTPTAAPLPRPCAETSGRGVPTTGRRRDTVRRRTTRRLRPAARPRRRNGAARTASRCRRIRSRRDAGRGGDRQSHTTRERRWVPEVVRASQRGRR